MNVGFASLHYTVEEGTADASLLEVCLQVLGDNVLSQASLVKVQTLPGSAEGMYVTKVCCSIYILSMVLYTCVYLFVCHYQWCGSHDQVSL